MQNVWSRAAPTKCTCKCAFCHSSTALSRTSTSSTLRRRLRFRDVFTVFYSTILASAAVADSYQKSARRRKLEVAIEEARKELAAIEEQQRIRVAALSLGPDSSENISNPWSTENTWDKVFKSAAGKSRERELLGFEDLLGPPLSVLKQLPTHEIESLMRDPAVARLNTGCDSERDLLDLPVWYRPWVIKKTKTLEWSVRKLVYRLLLSCETERFQAQHEKGEEASHMGEHGTITQAIVARIDKCERALDFIKRNPQDPSLWLKLRSPTVPSYSRKGVYGAAFINDRLLGLFRSFQENGEGIHTLLSSICSLLLSTSDPPDIQVYNTLIIWLCQLQRMADVQIVIDSMRECWIRPNQTTLFVMLHYYTITQKEAQFLELAKVMQGVHSRGLWLEHPDKAIPPGLQARYVVREYSKPDIMIRNEDEDLLDEDQCSLYPDRNASDPAVCHPSRKVVRNARIGFMDGHVYRVMIHGYLKFGWSGLAMRYYRQLISDGFKPDLLILKSILEHCTRNRDWDAGVAVWREIQRLAQGLTHAVLGLMLTLCRSCGNFIEYGQVLDYGVRIGLIPSASSHFPDEIGRGLTDNPLDTSDFVAFPRQPLLQIIISRDSLERAVKLLGYMIASAALELAKIDVNASKGGIGFKIYLKIKQQYRARGSREIASRATARNAEVDVERVVNQQSRSIIDKFTEEPAMWSERIEPSSGIEEAQEMVADRYHKTVAAIEDRVDQKSLIERSSVMELLPEDEEIQNADHAGSSNTDPNIAVEGLGEDLAELHEDYKPAAGDAQLDKPLMHLITRLTSIEKQHSPLDLASLEEQRTEMRLPGERSTQLSPPLGEQVLEDQQRHYDPLAVLPDGTDLGPQGKEAQDPMARQYTKPDVALEEQVNDLQSPLAQEVSVTAVVEGDYETENLPELRFVAPKDDPSRSQQTIMRRCTELDDEAQIQSEAHLLTLNLTQPKNAVWRLVGTGEGVQTLHENERKTELEKALWEPIFLEGTYDDQVTPHTTQSKRWEDSGSKREDFTQHTWINWLEPAGEEKQAAIKYPFFSGKRHLWLPKRPHATAAPRTECKDDVVPQIQEPQERTDFIRKTWKKPQLTLVHVPDLHLGKGALDLVPGQLSHWDHDQVISSEQHAIPSVKRSCETLGNDSTRLQSSSQIEPKNMDSRAKELVYSVYDPRRSNIAFRSVWLGMDQVEKQKYRTVPTDQIVRKAGRPRRRSLP